MLPVSNTVLFLIHHTQAVPLVPKFASLFGGPPIGFGGPISGLEAPQSAFGGPFGGPPIVWRPPNRAPKILASKNMTSIVWRPPNRIWKPFWRSPNRFGGPPIGHLGALLEAPNHFLRLIWSFQMLKIERFRPKSICLYLQNLLKSDDFEGFEAEDILTERVYTTPRPSKCIRVWGATHNMCRSNEQRE